MNTTTSKYVGRTNKHGQIDIINANEAHLPHVYVTWWDGGMYVQACLPAERAENYRANADMRSVRPAVWVD